MNSVTERISHKKTKLPKNFLLLLYFESLFAKIDKTLGCMLIFAALQRSLSICDPQDELKLHPSWASQGEQQQKICQNCNLFVKNC
jgi:hypothetical protein